jgi:hypothetical protein
VLEKVRAQEAQVSALKEQVQAFTKERRLGVRTATEQHLITLRLPEVISKTSPADVPDPDQQVEAALKAFREAKDPEAKRRAAEALEAAARMLKEQPQKKPEKPGTKGGER